LRCSDTLKKTLFAQGSYERAGTIGFRCVADAVDDCGTNGTLCATEADAPPAVSFGASPSDWVLFGTAHGPVSKAGASQIGPVTSLDQPGPAPGPVLGATTFSYTGGEGPAGSGTSRGAALFSSGFAFVAAAPRAGQRATLRLHVGGLLRARGRLVAQVGDQLTTVRVERNASV
jgi:hypothetical protein